MQSILLHEKHPAVSCRNKNWNVLLTEVNPQLIRSSYKALLEVSVKIFSMSSNNTNSQKKSGISKQMSDRVRKRLKKLQKKKEDTKTQKKPSTDFTEVNFDDLGDD